MKHTRFVGLDVHKDQMSVAVAESGRGVEYLGQISNDPVAVSKLCDRLARPGTILSFCYEAGPCGYGLIASSPDRPWLRGGGSVLDPHQTGRPRQDRPPRCHDAGPPAPGRGTDLRLGAG
jgi:hypothetical protein